MAIEDMVNQRLKCRAYKNLENPDAQESLCGEPVQVDPENGREFFEIPAHTRDYMMKKMPSYEFTEAYDISEKTKPALPKAKGGRPPKKVVDPDDE